MEGGVAGQHPQRPAEPLPPQPELRHPQQRLPGRQGRQLFRRRPRGLVLLARLRLPHSRGPASVRDGADRGGGRPAGRSVRDRPRGLRARAGRTDAARGRPGAPVPGGCLVVRPRDGSCAPPDGALGRGRRPLPFGAGGRGPRAGLPADRHPGTPGRERRGFLPAAPLPRPGADGIRGAVLVALGPPALPARERSPDRASDPEVRTPAARAPVADGLQPPRPSPVPHRCDPQGAPGFLEAARKRA